MRQQQNYNANQHQTEDVEPVFESVGARRTRRYYVGGIAKYSNKSGILLYLKTKGVVPDTLKLINTKRGSLAAKISVYENDRETLERKSFWPRKVYCRRWYSEAEWESLFYTCADKEDNSPSAVD